MNNPARVNIKDFSEKEPTKQRIRANIIKTISKITPEPKEGLSSATVV